MHMRPHTLRKRRKPDLGEQIAMIGNRHIVCGGRKLFILLATNAMAESGVVRCLVVQICVNCLNIGQDFEF